MPGRFAIFAASLVGIGSISGVALGNFATTTKQASVDATDIHDLSSQIGNTTSNYGPSYQVEASTTDMAPDHIPVCRKGCGPTLGQRRTGAYFEHSVQQLDNIYGTHDDLDTEDYGTPEPDTANAPPVYSEAPLTKASP
ncbi:MAG: hypothetical protein ACSLE1_05815 [Sphingobium sp.]